MSAATQQLRRDIAALTTLAGADLDLLFRQVQDAAQAREALMDLLPALIDTYGLAAASVAADWYDDLRAEQEVTGRFRAVVADIPDTGAQALAGWASDTATDLTTMQTLVAGGMQRRIANFSRDTVSGSALADPRSDGWMRVGNGDNCPFCNLLIGRGAVYSESTVKFASHDHCDCQAAPSWGRPSDIFDVDEYRRSQRNRSDSVREADNARAREWIADHL